MRTLIIVSLAIKATKIKVLSDLRYTTRLVEGFYKMYQKLSGEVIYNLNKKFVNTNGNGIKIHVHGQYVKVCLVTSNVTRMLNMNTPWNIPMRHVQEAHLYLQDLEIQDVEQMFLDYINRD